MCQMCEEFDRDMAEFARSAEARRKAEEESRLAAEAARTKKADTTKPERARASAMPA